MECLIFVQIYKENFLLSETFLLEDDKFFAKGYRTFKTRNTIRRKGCGILISKNLMVSVLTLKNDGEGRYINVSPQFPYLRKKLNYIYF